jgi:hypothetical protein
MSVRIALGENFSFFAAPAISFLFLRRAETNWIDHFSRIRLWRLAYSPFHAVARERAGVAAWRGFAVSTLPYP